MKTFDDLTESELVALTDAEFDRFVMMEAAEAGFDIPVDPGPAPSKKIAPDMELFSVQCPWFAERAHAENIARIINSYPTSYKQGWMPGYSDHKAEPVDEQVQVVTSRMFSLELAGRTSDALAAAAAEHQAWQKRKNEYDRAYQRRNDIARELREKLIAARQTTRDRETIRQQHKQFLELADGSRRTAARFLERQFPNAQALCPELFIFTSDDPPDIPLSKRRQYNYEAPPNAAVDENEIF